MTERETIKKINTTNWYRQGGAILPYYPSSAYRALFDYFGGFNYFRGGVNYGYFDRDRAKKICDRIISGVLKKSNYCHYCLIRPWRKRRDEVYLFSKKITPHHLAGLSDRELFRLHEEFIGLRLRMWRIGALIESFDPWGMEIIKEYLNKNQLKIAPEDAIILSGSRKMSFNQREQLERLRLAKQYKNRVDIKLKIVRHAERFYWLLNSWAVISRLSEEYFWHQMRKDIRVGPVILGRRIQEIENYPIQMSNKIRQLTKKYHLPQELRLIFSFFSQMADWRDERKEQIHRVNSIADLFLVELSQRTGIEKKYLSYLDAHEVTSIDRVNKLRRNLFARRKDSLYYTFGKTGIRWFVGRRALRLHTLLKKSLLKDGELNGSVANQGKSVGKVKIIITSHDFNKMHRGDILVTQMTRSEYLPILHKAAAIVTDEGGITCHAAIISRELGIPCIIGTQIASSVLRDGDLVEVDADKGVVRRIK